MEADNPLPAAIQILKSCGLASGLGRPTGPTKMFPGRGAGAAPAGGGRHVNGGVSGRMWSAPSGGASRTA